MKRAMETAVHLFKCHPNKANITFIVTPNLRENLKYYSGISSSFAETKRIMLELCAKYGLKADFSQFYGGYSMPELW